MVNGDAQLLPHEGPGALAAKEVLGPNFFCGSAIHMGKLDVDRVLGVLALVRSEVRDRPGALDLDTVLLEVRDEDPLDKALMQESREGVAGVDEAGAARPGACARDALADGVPESHLVHAGGLVLHDVALQAHVAEEVQGPGLDAIGTASGGGFGAVVDVLDLVAPASQAGRQHEADGAGSHNDCAL